MRLLLAGVFEYGYVPTFKKMSLIRMPICLGSDAFTNGRISKPKADLLLKTMVVFKNLIEAYQPLDIMACATSAMREAENGQQICQRIEQKAGIKIDIIDGLREAQVIFENKSADKFGGLIRFFAGMWAAAAPTSRSCHRAASLSQALLIPARFACWKAWWPKAIGAKCGTG